MTFATASTPKGNLPNSPRTAVLCALRRNGLTSALLGVGNRRGCFRRVRTLFLWVPALGLSARYLPRRQRVSLPIRHASYYWHSRCRFSDLSETQNGRRTQGAHCAKGNPSGCEIRPQRRGKDLRKTLSVFSLGYGRRPSFGRGSTQFE